jgi:hypothetical protein
MAKRTLKHLEKLFAAEVDGKPAQLNAKTAARLIGLGLITERINRQQDRLGTFTWATHELTHAGRLAYCLTCHDEPTP